MNWQSAAANDTPGRCGEVKLALVRMRLTALANPTVSSECSQR